MLLRRDFQPMYHHSAVLGGTSVVTRIFDGKPDMEKYVADSEEKYVAGSFLEEGEGFLFFNQVIGGATNPLHLVHGLVDHYDGLFAKTANEDFSDGTHGDIRLLAEATHAQDKKDEAWIIRMEAEAKADLFPDIIPPLKKKLGMK